MPFRCRVQPSTHKQKLRSQGFGFTLHHSLPAWRIRGPKCFIIWFCLLYVSRFNCKENLKPIKILVTMVITHSRKAFTQVNMPDFWQTRHQDPPLAASLALPAICVQPGEPLMGDPDFVILQTSSCEQHDLSHQRKCRPSNGASAWILSMQHLQRRKPCNTPPRATACCDHTGVTGREFKV